MLTYLFGARTANIWAKHDEIWSVTMKIFGLKTTIEDLKITTTTVNILFMFYRKLNNQWLVAVAEWCKFG